MAISGRSAKRQEIGRQINPIQQVVAVALDQRVAALEQDVDAAEEGDRQPEARQDVEGVAGVVPDEHAGAEQEDAHQERPCVQPDALAAAQLFGVANPDREAREEAEARCPPDSGGESARP